MGSLSAVVEWENTKTSGTSRAAAMLRTLMGQLDGARARFDAAPEILLVYDEDQASAPDVLAAVGADSATFGGTIRPLPATGLDYYRQKNYGATHANGDLILLVDSDVAPEDGWLDRLLDCQAQENADVVCGSTYVEPKGVYGKAFSLFWFFPLPTDPPVRRRNETFFANNVLFRRDVLLTHPFPDTPLVRGRCTQLARILTEHQRSIYLEGAARVGHPPPNGLSHFVKRALCHGFDNVTFGEPPGLYHSLRRFKWRAEHAWNRIRAHGRDLELGGMGAAGALGIAMTYNLIEFAGELITYAKPRWIGENIRV